MFGVPAALFRLCLELQSLALSSRYCSAERASVRRHHQGTAWPATAHTVPERSPYRSPAVKDGPHCTERHCTQY